MYKALVFVLLVALPAVAQVKIPENYGAIATPAENGRGNKWVEVRFPVAKIGAFADAIEDSKEEARGNPGSLAVGWEPLANKTNLPKFLRMLGLTASATALNSAKFDQPLFSYTVVNEFAVFGQQDVFDACRGFGYGDCGYCANGIGVCARTENVVNVNTRDTYVKYSNGSVSLGAYVSPELFSRISTRVGVEVAGNSVYEGIRTDELKHSVERSVNGTLAAGYIWKRATLGFAMKKSVSGMKNSEKAVYVGFRF